MNAPVLLIAFHRQNPGAIRKLKVEDTDCGQRTLSLDQGECTKSQRTQPQTIKCPQMHIRSARVADERASMSGECTPVNPSPSPSQSPWNNDGTLLPLCQVIDNLILSARQQRCHL